ncbi:MAG: hypothetical protein ACI3VN_00930 [Candidatus Onthomonas sp.]
MTAYFALSPLIYNLYAVCAMLLMIGALLLLVTVCVLRIRGRCLFLVAALTAVVLLVMQGISDVSHNLFLWNCLFSPLARVTGNVPYVVLAILLPLLAVAEGIFLVFLRQRRKKAPSGRYQGKSGCAACRSLLFLC